MNVGIDLGTTYSAVAYFDKNKGVPVILKNGEGENTTPSVTHVENGKVTIGSEAKSFMSSGDTNSVAFYKNVMGEKESTFYIDGKNYTAEDISAMYLAELKKDIEQTNGIKIDGAVITCPAYFDEARRNATINAGKRAGLNVLKIINEPTSAIIAYGLTGGKKKNIMVYDLGGGTFDVTIAEVNGSKIRVLTTNGDHSLGGKNWDSVIADYLTEQFMAEYNMDITCNPEDVAELQVACEDTKKKLTTMNEVTAVVRSEGFVGRYKVTKEDFEHRTEFLLNQTEMLIDRCFSDMEKNGVAGFGWGNIDEVILVGGSTRMPQVRQMVTKKFGKPPVTANINVDTIVAAGAAIQAELCVSETLMLGGSAIAKTLGGGTSGGRLEIRGSDIEDITSHSLGMLAFNESKEIINSIILKKDSNVGVKENKDYEFSGKDMHAYVLQGEESDPHECNLLYHYIISGMPEGQKNNIRVSYLYDQNGVVQVSGSMNGRELNVKKELITESIDEIIERLKREREEAEKEARKRSRIEIMLMIDTSGSMSGNRMTEARKAAKDFVDEFDLRKVFISVISFSDRSRYKCEWENEKRKLYKAIDAIQVGDGGYGNAENPISNNYKKFNSKDCPRVIVILTDGYWNDQTTEEYAAQKAKNDGIIIYGIGIGDADETFLGRISSGKGKKVDLSQLSQTFKEVASSIATEAGNTLK